MNNSYKGIILSAITANLADWIVKISLPILIYERTQSPLDTALSYMLIFLPFIFTSFLSCIVSDRLPKKTTLIISDALSLFGLTGLIVAFYYHLPVGYFYFFIILTAFGSPIKHAIYQSLIRACVPDEKLDSVNSQIASYDNLVLILSPLLAGTLISIIGIVPTLLMNSILYLLCIMTVLIFCKKNSITSTPSLSLQQQLNTIKAFLYQNSILTRSAILFFFNNFSTHLLYVNFTYIFLNQLQLGAKAVGLAYSAIGIGALVGSLIAPFIIKIIPYRRLLSLNTLLAGCLLIPIIWFYSEVILYSMLGITSIFGAINMVAFFTYRQKVTPQHMLGGVVSLTRLCAFASIPLAAILGGLIIEQITFTSLILLCAIIKVVVGFIFLLSTKHTREVCHEY